MRNFRWILIGIILILCFIAGFFIWASKQTSTVKQATLTPSLYADCTAIRLDQTDLTQVFMPLFTSLGLHVTFDATDKTLVSQEGKKVSEIFEPINLSTTPIATRSFIIRPLPNTIPTFCAVAEVYDSGNSGRVAWETRDGQIKTSPVNNLAPSYQQ